MSIIKIQGVRNLKQSIDYILQDHKTRVDLISTFACDRHYILEDFENLYDERQRRWRRGTKNKAKMLIQSFNPSDNVSPELAHQIGKEYAENYLEGKHQYVVATHLDGNNIHNHIIFNQVERDSLKMFNTKRAITNTKLHQVNNNLSKKYELTIPKKQKNKRSRKNMSQREVTVRKKGESFKAEMERVIDEVIEDSENYEEFLEKLGKTYDLKDGRYLSIRNKKSGKFMRTKTLGINYFKSSIKYRIEHPDFEIAKNPYTVESKKIDKSQDKYKNNYGLRKWATKKNIMYLQDISDLVINHGKSLEEIEGVILEEEKMYKSLKERLDEHDKNVNALEKRKDCFDIYKSYAPMISDYKKAENKKEFKKKHFDEFREYDRARRDMTFLKREYGLLNTEDLLNLKDTMKNDRKEAYKLYSHLGKDKNLSQIKRKKKTKRRSR